MTLNHTFLNLSGFLYEDVHWSLAHTIRLWFTRGLVISTASYAFLLFLPVFVFVSVFLQQRFRRGGKGLCSNSFGLIMHPLSAHALSQPRTLLHCPHALKLCNAQKLVYIYVHIYTCITWGMQRVGKDPSCSEFVWSNTKWFYWLFFAFNIFWRLSSRKRLRTIFTLLRVPVLNRYVCDHAASLEVSHVHRT